MGIWECGFRRDSLRGKVWVVELWYRNPIGLMLARAGMADGDHLAAEPLLLEFLNGISGS